MEDGEGLALCGDVTRDVAVRAGRTIKVAHRRRAPGARAPSEDTVLAAWGGALCALTGQPSAAIARDCGAVAVYARDTSSLELNVAPPSSPPSSPPPTPPSAPPPAPAPFRLGRGMPSERSMPLGPVASVHAPAALTAASVGSIPGMDGRLVSAFADAELVVVLYDASLFVAASVGVLAERFAYNLDFPASATSPSPSPSSSSGVVELNTLRTPPAELERLLELSGEPASVRSGSEWPVRCGACETVVALFRAAAAEHPAATALAQLDGPSLSYAELEARTDRLSRRLASLHSLAAAGLARARPQLGEGRVVTTPLVAVLMDRGAGLVCAFLAAQKAGLGYVPVQPDYPAERVEFILRDAGCAIVLCDAASSARAREISAITGALVVNVDVEDEPASAATREPAELPTPSSADDIMYVLYTSGSTGQPKGVALSVRAALSAILHTIESMGGGERDGVVLFASAPVFDLSVVEIYCPLVSGGATLKIAPPNAMRSPDVMRRLLAEAPRPTWIQATPSLLKLLCAGGALAEPGLAVRHLAVCGELLRQDVALEAWDLLRAASDAPALALYNAWGPTESAVYGTAARFSSRAELLRSPHLSIGRALAFRGVFVLERGSSRLAALGAKGELCLTGPGLALGYLNREPENAKAFVQHPLRAGARLYRCGDVARWRPDTGEIEIMGRTDNQVKVRGFRVELGEVEAQLSLANAGRLRECAVLAHDANGATILVAYVVPEALAAKDALNFGALPHYMRPSRIIGMEELPKNQSGKTDRKRLPDPSRRLTSLARDTELSALPPIRRDTAILSPLERQVLAAVRDVVGDASIGVDDNYFLHGATSVSAVRIRAATEALINAKLHGDLFFDRPTAKQIAQAAAEAAAEASAEAAAEAAAEAQLGASAASPPATATATATAAAAAAASAAAAAAAAAPRVVDPVVRMLVSAADAPAVFLFHPAGGVTYTFFELVGQLALFARAGTVSSGLSAFALQDPWLAAQGRGVAERRRAEATIASMCSDYWAAIKRVRPRGPYYFGGHSLGGLLAIETAALVELEQGAGAVSRIFLLDSDFVEGDSEEGLFTGIVNAVTSGDVREHFRRRARALEARGSRFRASAMKMVSKFFPHGDSGGGEDEGEDNNEGDLADADAQDVHTVRILKMVGVHVDLAKLHGAPLNSGSALEPKPSRVLDAKIVLFSAMPEPGSSPARAEEIKLNARAFATIARDFEHLPVFGATHMSLVKGEHAVLIARKMVFEVLTDACCAGPREASHTV